MIVRPDLWWMLATYEVTGWPLLAACVGTVVLWVVAWQSGRLLADVLLTKGKR